MKKENKRWTREEENILLRQIRVYPHNLTKCFLIVAEQTGRTKGAVSAHWYSTLSKRDDVVEFATISHSHLAKNRKNSTGVPIQPSVWTRFFRLVRSVLS